jgi:hypothetical protein
MAAERVLSPPRQNEGGGHPMSGLLLVLHSFVHANTARSLSASERPIEIQPEFRIVGATIAC